MATNLTKVYISRIISMTFYDRNTGKVLDEWGFDKCKDLNVEMEVITSYPNPIEKKIVNLTEEE